MRCRSIRSIATLALSSILAALPLREALGAVAVVYPPTAGLSPAALAASASAARAPGADPGSAASAVPTLGPFLALPASVLPGIVTQTALLPSVGPIASERASIRAAPEEAAVAAAAIPVPSLKPAPILAEHRAPASGEVRLRRPGRPASARAAAALRHLSSRVSDLIAKGSSLTAPADAVRDGGVRLEAALTEELLDPRGTAEAVEALSGERPAARLELRRSGETLAPAQQQTPVSPPAGAREPASRSPSPLGRPWVWTLAGLVAGVAAGLLAGPGAAALPALSAPTASMVAAGAHASKLCLAAIRLLAGPLVFTSILKSVGGDGGMAQAGTVGWRLLLYSKVEGIVSALIGTGAAVLLRPGSYGARAMAGLGSAHAAASSFAGFGRLLASFIPSDPLSPFIAGNIPQIVFLALAAGAVVALLRSTRRASLRKLADAVLLGGDRAHGLVVQAFRLVMLAAPVIVFGATAQLVSSAGAGAFLGVGAFAGTATLAMALLVAVYCGMLRFVAGISPRAFFAAAREPVLAGLATSSSAAALPATLRAAKEKLGLDPAIVDLVIPLWIVFGKCGTFASQIVAVLFLAQAAGLPLTAPTVLTLLLVLEAVSVGTPAVPGGSLAAISATLSALGIPLDGFSLILGVDRPLDMLQTAVNVLGNLTVAAMMDALVPKGRRPATAPRVDG